MKVHLLALATALATFALLCIGGLVNPTGSSLACPDWPLCFGQVMPEMTGGVLYEHSHRLGATAVGLLTVLLAVATWRSRQDQPVLRRLAVVAVGMVVFQGVLGGLTVLLRLPPLVSSLHLATSMAFFLLVVYLGFRLDPRRRHEPVRGLPRRLQLLAVGAVYAQVVLGGLVRHLGAGRACGADPIRCGGVLWPELPVEQLHVVHRLSGVIVFLLVLLSSSVAWRRAGLADARLARAAALAAPIVALGQVALGILTVMTHVGVAAVTAHVGGAALLLATTLLTACGLGRHGVRGAAWGPDRDDATGLETAGAVS